MYLKMTIRINTDNEAFDWREDEEISEILMQCIALYGKGFENVSLHDANGKDVCWLTVEKENE